jgi:hypothetical protein
MDLAEQVAQHPRKDKGQPKREEPGPLSRESATLSRAFAEGQPFFMEARQRVLVAMEKSAPLTRSQAKAFKTALSLLDHALAVLAGRAPLPEPPVLDPMLQWQMRLDYERAVGEGHEKEAKQERVGFVKQWTVAPRGRPQKLAPEWQRKIKLLHDEGLPPSDIVESLKALGLPVSRQTVAITLKHHFRVKPHQHPSRRELGSTKGGL